MVVIIDWKANYLLYRKLPSVNKVFTKVVVIYSSDHPRKRTGIIRFRNFYLPHIKVFKVIVITTLRVNFPKKQIWMNLVGIKSKNESEKNHTVCNFMQSSVYIRNFPNYRSEEFLSEDYISIKTSDEDNGKNSPVSKLRNKK